MILSILPAFLKIQDTRITIIAIIATIASLFLFAYENKKRQRNKKNNKKLYNELENKYIDIKNECKRIENEHEKLNDKEKILSQIINCVNKALEDEGSFQNSMGKLVNTLRTTFHSEYCAIGKVVNGIVEDYACDYDKHDDKKLKTEQENSFNKTKKVNINETKYLVCEALMNKEKQITYDEKDLKKRYNDHYEHYKKILKSGNLFNTTIIPFRNNKFDNYGYIQFINAHTENDIRIGSINQFQDSLLQLVQMVIKKEEDKRVIDKQNKFRKDSYFIKNIIEHKENTDIFLDKIMEYLSNEFNAAVISFRIPVLNGEDRVPLFYLRRCYVNLKKIEKEEAEQIKEHYYKNRIIRNKNELGGYYSLKCCNKENILLENSMNSDYYSIFNLNLKEETLIMPVLKDIGKYKCMREEGNPICEFSENRECVERFTKLYGLFKLRLCKNDKEQDSELEEEKERLSYLSHQITLILNSIVDKYENESLKIFRKSLKRQQFLKIRDFDNQFVEIIKKSTHAKECSIYRYRKNDDYSKQIYLSATTSKKILYKGVKYTVEDIIQQLNYLISDDTSMIVRVFTKKEPKYLYNLNNRVNIGNFIEMINGSNTLIENESVFLIPIIKKDKEETCLGVVVLLGKEKDEHTISTSYWEQDKGIIGFIVEMFTRILEADNERLTFLSQLRHELLVPISEVVQENDFMFNKYEIRKEDFNKGEVLGQLKNNIDNSFLFKHIITDIDLIYSSSIKDIVYNIELQQEPQKILKEVVAFFRTEIPILMSVSAMPPLYMDKDKIKQVFINILKNAIKYSYKKSYRRKPIEIYYKSPKESDSKLHEIRFVNYGIGILDEDKERIFELYKRGQNASDNSGSPSGSGMGLYIVKEIMKAHGGDCIIRKLGHSDIEPTEISLVFPKNKSK